MSLGEIKYYVGKSDKPQLTWIVEYNKIFGKWNAHVWSWSQNGVKTYIINKMIWNGLKHSDRLTNSLYLGGNLECTNQSVNMRCNRRELIQGYKLFSNFIHLFILVFLGDEMKINFFSFLQGSRKNKICTALKNLFIKE